SEQSVMVSDINLALDMEFDDEDAMPSVSFITQFFITNVHIGIANDETDREQLITRSPILKSNENKNIEAVLGAYQKIKKGMFNSQWLLNPQFASFLRQYKPDSAKVLCIASNEHFSVCDGGKNDIHRHIKLKRHNNNIKSFGINRQLITSTMKSNKEVEETAAAEGTFVYHEVKHSHSYFISTIFYVLQFC
ncbi:unnamed protein product, partial [Rotaria sordida]